MTIGGPPPPLVFLNCGEKGSLSHGDIPLLALLVFLHGTDLPQLALIVFPPSRQPLSAHVRWHRLEYMMVCGAEWSWSDSGWERVGSPT